MKLLLYFVMFIFPVALQCQELKGKVGVIELEFIKKNYILDSNDKLTNKKDNKSNQPFQRIFFDSKGRRLKRIDYGDMHNEELSSIKSITTYDYVNDTIRNSYLYRSNYKEELVLHEKVKTIYNSKYRILYDSTFYVESDSIWFYKSNPWYKSSQFKSHQYLNNPTRIKKNHNPTFYYLTTFDSANRIISEKQISNDKVRWENNIIYLSNKSIGNVQTYYNDQNDYKAQEIIYFNNKLQAIKFERILLDSIGKILEKRFHYRKNGIFRRIETFQFGWGNLFRHDYVYVKVKSKVRLTKEIVNRIISQGD